MSLNKEPEVLGRLSRGRKPSRSHSDEKIDQSLEVLGFKSWKDLETTENVDGSKTFDKEKLNLAFRKKVIEVEEKKQNEANKEGDIQRQMLEAIIANLTDPEKKKKNSITDRAPDVYEAYQIILSEHYKREKHQDKKTSTSNSKLKKNRRNTISVPKSSSKDPQKDNSDDITNLSKEVGKVELKNDKTGKKKVTSSGYGRKKMTKSASTNRLSEYDEIQNPMLAYVTNLTRTQSYNNVRTSRFRRNVQNIQKASAVTKLFNQKGNQKFVKRWKLLLQ